MAATGEMLCDYTSSASASEENGNEHAGSALVSKDSPKTISDSEKVITDNSPKLPLSYSMDRKNSPACESSSSRHRKRHYRSQHIRSSHRRSKRKRSSCSPIGRKSRHKHSSRKHHTESRRHRDHRSRHYRSRHKHRHRSSSSSSSSTSSSSSSSSSEPRSRRKHTSGDRKSSKTLKNVNDKNISSTSTTTSTNTISGVTVQSLINPAVTQNIHQMDALEIIRRIQRHRQELAKVQATAAKAASQLPKYYNPSNVNAVKLAEQKEKRKLLWSKTESDSKTSLWSNNAIIAGKGDTAAAAKFRKLMGIHDSDTTNGVSDNSSVNDADAIRCAEDQAALFRRLESEYEMSRALTHTQRGAGLGFGTSSHVDYSAYSAMQENKDK